ncbi:MAG: alpha-amylase family glycosyl hydrolase [Xanthobacteraceae bacterium]|nr:alpha-amylase family glycosyl hydrolase [Xanthobacteraceae bacterium]
MMTIPWWQTAAIYQIYPRSFCDANGDGVGDLAGILARIPYLARLGVGAVWISPFYPSPMADFGYDITDYCGVDPLFGTLADIDALIAALHAAGLKLILDFVPNHTSDQHPWFVESRASRTSPKRDWYIWRDGQPGGGPPNNWLSEFGGSAWTFDPASGQYYHHAFLDSQPDLNWRNPQVAAAMHDAMRFWLARGVDGFRVDVMWHLMKDAAFRDNPPNPHYDASRPPHEALLTVHSADVAEVHAVVAGLRAVIEEFDDRVLIGEIYLPLERLVAYYGQDGRGAHLPFNFSLLATPWRADALAVLIKRYEALLPAAAWPNWVLGNHDRPRLASRIGLAQTAVAAMLLTTLRGTPTLYYGDELGLPQVAIPPERVRDPWEKNLPGRGLGRDGARTPMPWSARAFAGFSSVEPWLPLNPDFARRNVAAMDADPASLLNLTRRLLTLRNATPALNRGAIADVAAHGDVLSYRRSYGDDGVFVALNLGVAAAQLDGAPAGVIALSTHGDRAGEHLAAPLRLSANEGVVVRVET